jgi:hypothetical protein
MLKEKIRGAFWMKFSLFLLSSSFFSFFSNFKFVQQIFLSQSKSTEAVARKIANFFEKLMELQRKKGHVDERVLEELPYALVKTGDTTWLKEVLLDYNVLFFPLFLFSPPLSSLFFSNISLLFQIFLKLSTQERMYELRDFWSSLGTPEEMTAEYCQMLLGYSTEEDKPSNEILISLFDQIADLALEVGAFQYALFISEKCDFSFLFFLISTRSYPQFPIEIKIK